VEENDAAIGHGPQAHHQFARHEAIHEAHGSVMHHLEAGSQFADPERAGAPPGVQGQEGLVQLWGEPGAPRRGFIEVEELPQREAKFRLRFEQILSTPRSACRQRFDLLEQ